MDLPDTFLEFLLIKTDTTLFKRRMTEIAILEHTYRTNGIKTVVQPNRNHNIQEHGGLDWEFEVHLMHKAVLEMRPYKINFRATPTLSRQANRVLLLAMVHGHTDIVRYFLNRRLFGVNDSILGSTRWPSYFLLSCACPRDVFLLFRAEYFSYTVSWCGMTPTLLCSFTDCRLRSPSDLDYVTYQEYASLLQLRGIEIERARRNYPLFVLDFVCMQKKTPRLREILENTPEAGALSRLSFLVQNADHFTLILTKYGYQDHQEFNGMTPLHLSCKNNAFFTFVFLLYSGFSLVADDQDMFPHEVAHPAISQRVASLLRICASEPQYDRILKRRRMRVNTALLRSDNGEFVQLMNLSKEKNRDVWGVFTYLNYNKESRIYRSSRFSITSIFSSQKRPTQVEIEVANSMRRFINTTVPERLVHDKYNTLFRK